MNRRDLLGGVLGAGLAAGFGAWWFGRGASPSSGAAQGGTLTLAQLPSDVAAVYRYVEANQALTQRVPCYCGCGEHSGHGSVRDCFINARGEYDDHGSGCDICLDIVRDVQKYSGQGMDITAIRARVDGRFKQYGPPTKTQ
jgi:hypothetical protein